MELIHSGLIGDVVGMRCHWFRNADWRRPVPSPGLERRINWRLYRESSGGLMTELACHQLEVCNWAAERMPEEIMGMGDIVHWKDGREVYDSVNVIYRYADGRKICYESLISNKFNGMEDQILGSRGTMELAKGVYYLEEDHTASGIRQLIGQLKERAFAAIPAAGPSWRPETRVEYPPHPIIEGAIHVNGGQSMIGADKDGSDVILSAFCHSCITGEKAPERCRGGLLLDGALPAGQPGHGGAADDPLPRAVPDSLHEVLDHERYRYLRTPHPPRSSSPLRPSSSPLRRISMPSCILTVRGTSFSHSWATSS